LSNAPGAAGNATEEVLKELGLRSGAKVVGIAAASAFNEYVPVGHRPEDFLPGAKSVIVAERVNNFETLW